MIDKVVGLEADRAKATKSTKAKGNVTLLDACPKDLFLLITKKTCAWIIKSSSREYRIGIGSFGKHKDINGNEVIAKKGSWNKILPGVYTSYEEVLDAIRKMGFGRFYEKSAYRRNHWVLNSTSRNFGTEKEFRNWVTVYNDK